MTPMLPTKYSPSSVTYPCYVQPKLAGQRCLYQFGAFQPWNGVSWAPNTLRHLSDPLSKIFNASTILDGVLYVQGWPLKRIQKALTEPSEDTPLLEFHVFDVVNFHRSFDHRYMAPASILIDSAHRHKAKPVETHRISGNDQESGENEQYFFDKWISQGYDGMIYRLDDWPYSTGKTKYLLKRDKPRRNYQRKAAQPDERGQRYPARSHA
jgi:hypothetical protein